MYVYQSPNSVTMVCLVGFVVILSAVSVRVESATGSLRFVSLVFRHGDRTPADTYPTDPHINYDFPPYGWGQLTNEGRMNQYKQGQWLRTRYGEFLGDQFSNNAVRLQSTDVDRTLMSAELTAAGLFPPCGDQRWNTELAWQPVPVHSQPLDQDSLLLVRIPCPRYSEELDRVKTTAEVKKYLDSLKPLYQDLSNHSGLSISNPDDVQSLYSTMLAEVQSNLSLPAWTKDYFPEKMAPVTAYSFTLNAYNDELKRLKGGPLLKQILNNMRDTAKTNGSKRKMVIYAGHDSTVANVLSALKVWDEQIPVYNTLAIFELYQLETEYRVKVFLRNSTEHDPYLLRIPGCKVLCPLEKVFELTKTVLPENLTKECQSHDPDYIPPPPSGP